MVVNGWDVARDNNRSKSVGAQLALTPAAGDLGPPQRHVGPERPGNDDGLAHACSTWSATFKAGSRLDAGRQRRLGHRAERGRRPGADARSGAGSPDTCASASPRLFALIAARARSFDDRDGVRTGAAQTLTRVHAHPGAAPDGASRSFAGMPAWIVRTIMYSRRIRGLSQTQPSVLPWTSSVLSNPLPTRTNEW